MLSEQEALAPMVLGEVRDILQADMGALDDLRIEADAVVLTFEGQTVRCDLPHIENVFDAARNITSELISRLNLGHN